jgi:predicted alpha/beta-fold hydrolase
VVISNPWNLDVSSHGLVRGIIGREIYSKVMGTNMKKLYELHHEQISKNPKISPERVRAITHLHEFDAEIQCPTWGYPTAASYYRDASSVDSMLDARIPLFAINATDDPVSFPLPC